MTTLKIYQKNPYIKEFHANITKIDQKSNDEVHIKLNQTAFYPEGGGQPSDKGFLDGFRVSQVYESNGEIFHVVDGLPTHFENVPCQIDWDRRFDFMQQHLGQHILSAGLEKLFEAETIGFHLTESNLTIDIDKYLEIEDLDRVEFFINQIVSTNLSVKTHYPASPSEAAAFPLRKDVTVHENPRIVEIDQFDYSPCGGTHPKRTGEVGMIKLTGKSIYKGGLRIEFLCGNRALKDYALKHRILTALRNDLSCHENDLPDQCRRLREELKETSGRLKKASEKLLAFEVEKALENSLSRNNRRLVSNLIETENAKELSRFASRVLETDPSAILALACSNTDQTTLLLAASPEEPSLGLNRILKDVIEKHKGRGGGNAHHAQGIVPDAGAAEQLLRQLLDKIELELEKSSC